MPITNKESHTNEDIKFLIYCCQTEVSENNIKFITSYLSAITNYQQIITTATQHGILSLVYKTIKKLQPDMKNLLLALHPHYLSTVQSNMSMSATLLKVLNLFKENNIKALSFKGPSLAQMAYGDITLRQFGDLDILIHKEDIKKIEALCISMGYKPYYDLTEVQKEVWYTYAKDMVFYHPVNKSVIEMHWLLLDADFPLQVDLDAIWKDTNTVEINRHPVQTFSSDALLLYLCVHGSKHLWERIVWIKDIDLMIRTQNIHWDSLLLDAKKNNLKSMLFLGLHLAKLLFNTPLPKNIEVLLENEKVLSALSDFVFLNWEKEQSMFQNTRAMLKFFPTFSTKYRYLHKVIIKPSNHEYRFIALPKGLYWVYYFIRPYLLLRKYLTKN